MEQEPQPQIELIDVDVPRAEVVVPIPILEHVQWTVSAGDFWAVGALPGTGKTDLLTTAAGLQRPINGTHLLFGSDTSRLEEDELVEKRLRIGMVYTNGRLFPQLTVAENLALPICYHSNWPEERARDLVDASLAITGLAHLADRRPSQLTRNLYQRIGLARALALEPEVLLVDNPLAAVDPRQGRWWLEFLCQLALGHPKLDRKITIVVAADDFRPWLDVARKFAVIKGKTFTHLGSADAVKKSEDQVVRELLMSAFA